MSVLNTIKIQNQDRIHLLNRPETFEQLQETFENKFGIDKKELSIYYLEKDDGRRTNVDDEDGYQLAFEYPDVRVKFLSDSASNNFKKINQPVTLGMLRSTYFKDAESTQNLSSEIITQNSKIIICYSCKSLKKDQLSCSECNGNDVIDYNTCFPTINNLIYSSVTGLVLNQFKALHNKIISKQRKINDSFNDESFNLNKSSGELNQSSSQINTSKSNLQAKNLSFFGRLLSTQNQPEIESHQKKMDQTTDVTLDITQKVCIGEQVDHQSMSRPMNSCMYTPKPTPNTEQMEIINEANIQPQIESTKEELIYEGVKVLKVHFKNGYMTIDIAIYTGQNTFPDNVYIVGSPQSVITQDVVIKLGNKI